MAPLKKWVLCLLYLSTSAAKPIHDSQASIFDPESSEETRPTSRSSNISDIYHGLPTEITLRQKIDHSAMSSTTKNALMKRDTIGLTFSKVYGNFIPVLLASERLRDFFIAVSREASNTWTSRPASALFTVTQGTFQLTVSCLGSTLPWPVLMAAAEKFSDYADHLFVNTFDAFYTETASSIGIAFSLRILKGLVGGLTEEAIRISAHSVRSLQRESSEAQLPSSLKRRTNTSPALKMTKFRPLKMTALVPTILVASRLEDFYNIIALKIESGFFKSWQPSKIIILDLFEFELSFACEKINVPWSFVQAFVIDMADWSSKQFTGMYEATVRGEGPLTNLVFIVSMKLKPQAGQRPTRV